MIQSLLVESAKGRDTLPLLQHTLVRLWEKPDLVPNSGWVVSAAHYETLGGMAKTLNDDADDLLGALRPDERKERAKKIFQELKEVGEDRDQRRPQRLSNLVRRTGASLQEVKAVVEQYSTKSSSLATSTDPQP